ncbi:MAG: RDD family protein [Gammaproteobacteria bacterium]|nr:RDD family protein [Gammaproteobacteria bacterium]MBU1477339.1 RDD family protein [Gammaproteobacteria bacterium]MBU2000482.1 RDD family protein [Gammaproteobacteria bacterium]MBU2133305.1 RDD family protein [Gammaproteobacteria bacterium]MBU2188391.1 RDD family protein [Gammaproteobacteria bacterium]
MKQQQTDLGKDPKTMVTPHAFTIADTVLYTPLAAPLKRALAMLIDGLLITVLAEQMDWMFVLLVVGIIYIEKRSHKLGRFLKWGLYAAMLAFMLLTTVDNIFNIQGSNSTDIDQSDQQTVLGEQVLTSLPAIISLSLCDNYACGKTQVQSLREVIENASASKGMTETERREIVLHTITNSSLSAADSEKLQTEVLDGTLWPVIAPQAELQMPDTQSEPKSTQAIGTSEPTDPAQGLVANTVKVPETTNVTKTVLQLGTKGKGADDEEESTTHSVIAWVKGFMSDMGLGFGWAAFYFTVFTARFDGQTLGKKMLGIRVIQLDGAKISLWAAFGRYGGYAAGFTTGLLGFMQIFWDANRQGIQDKISSTVVIDLAQMHKKQRLEQQEQGQNELSPALTSDDAASAHLTTSTRSEHL